MSLSVSEGAGVVRRGRWRWVAWALFVCVLGAVVWLLWPARPIPVTAQPSGQPRLDDAQLVERGRYLATVGNCQGCHTATGQAPYAGGTPIVTPFGTVYGPNLTPSEQGLAAWSADDFWRALHWGQRPDGRWLTPTFPYSNTTHVSRQDSDALFAFLRSLPPDATPSRPSELRWPYNTQAALKVWRAVYFRAAPEAEVNALAQATDELSRGRYWVQGLAHCSACHAPRNAWGGQSDPLALSGGLMPSGWYAPSLLDRTEGGVQGWSVPDVMRLLAQGRSGVHGVSGPMAEVVAQSLQHWREEDVRAVARYLVALPEMKAPPVSGSTVARVDAALGARLYEKHCASCHGLQGEGFTLSDGQTAYPPLAGNRSVTMDSAANLAQVILNGGFGVVTESHPRPFGMPPFVLTLDDASLAALMTHLRTAWGHQAGAVSPLDVHRLRTEPGR